jgi:hypothetical protein
MANAGFDLLRWALQHDLFPRADRDADEGGGLPSTRERTRAKEPS